MRLLLSITLLTIGCTTIYNIEPPTPYPTQTPYPTYTPLPVPTTDRANIMTKYAKELELEKAIEHPSLDWECEGKVIWHNIIYDGMVYCDAMNWNASDQLALIYYISSDENIPVHFHGRTVVAGILDAPTVFIECINSDCTTTTVDSMAEGVKQLLELWVKYSNEE